jgi:hypothetical protein
LPRPSDIQMSSSAPYSRTPSPHVPTSTRLHGTKFQKTITINTRAILFQIWNKALSVVSVLVYECVEYCSRNTPSRHDNVAL